MLELFIEKDVVKTTIVVPEFCVVKSQCIIIGYLLFKVLILYQDLVLLELFSEKAVVKTTIVVPEINTFLLS